MPALAVALVLFWSLGSAVAFDASSVATRIEAAFQPSLVHFLPLALVLALALHALAAIRGYLPRRARGRPPRRR